MENANLNKINKYFVDYIDKRFIKDMASLKDNEKALDFSYPYLLLVCSCIDLFGGIEMGFEKNNSGKRFEWFVIEWMGKINSLYNEESLAYLIYKCWRCGLAHQGVLKRGFGASTNMFEGDKHLYYVEDQDIICIHPLKFIDDFIKAQNIYREQINARRNDSCYILSILNNLTNMAHEDDDRIRENLNKFIEILKKNNFTFNSDAPIPSQAPDEGCL